MVLLLLLSQLAVAGDIALDGSFAVRRSTWRGDWLAGPRLAGGYRIDGVAGPDFGVWTEMGAVDTRLNTGISVGFNIALLPEKPRRPTARLYGVHQHEEGLVSVLEHPWTTTFGIGPGIRHRAGAGAKVGVELDLQEREGRRGRWVYVVDLDTTWFPETLLGPRWTVGLSAGFGRRITLEGL